jgi:transposase InsO family protein
MKYRFIKIHQGQWPISRMCQVLGVSSSGYYAWRNRPESQRTRRNRSLTSQIKQIYQGSRQTYGSPRIQAELRAQGQGCGRHRVARLMRLAGLSALHKRRRKVKTTMVDKRLPVAPNRLKRQFRAKGPNQVWLADLTYIATDQGWLYLAAVLDLYSRQIVGWAMAKTMTAELTCRALKMALAQRRPLPGLIHHSDRGSQYASQPYQALLAAHGLIPSMSGTGNCLDNAPMESFFATLKRELIYRNHYLTRRQAKTAVFDYVETFYNRVRRHSALGFLSPVLFEHSATVS